MRRQSALPADYFSIHSLIPCASLCSFSQLGFVFVFTQHDHHQQHHRQHTATDHHDKAAVPAEVVNGIADDSTRRDRATEVAEQTGKACCRPCRFLRGQLQLVKTNQHHRAANQEADGDLTGHINARITHRIQPVHHGGDSHQYHEEYTGGAAVAFEHFV